MRDGVRDRVNITIDSKLKRMFEDLQQIHKVEWTEILEKAVRDLLIETDPVKALEYEIKVADDQQEERRNALIRTKANIEKLNIQVVDMEKIQKEKEEQLQKLRLELFEKDFKILERQWKTQYINWNRIIDFGHFKNTLEAKKWLEKELKDRGIMEKYFNYP